LLRVLLNVFRPLRWYRNAFMLLGALLAIKIVEIGISETFVGILCAFVSICLVASGNYGINEVLDVEHDAKHPLKRHRAIPSGKISRAPVVIISIILYIAGISIVLPFRNIMLVISVSLLLLSGILYNVKPFRLKDKQYMDFIAESFNNPIRLLVGWYSVAPSDKVVPSSFILGFWFLGMFLMASKRFGEYRFFCQEASAPGKNKDRLVEYRKSFKHYTEERIIISMIASLSAFMFMLGALCIKYSVDLVLFLPFVIVFIVWFFRLAYEKDTIVKDPERVFEKKLFVLYAVVVCGVFIYLLFSGNQIFGFLLK